MIEEGKIYWFKINVEGKTSEYNGRVLEIDNGLISIKDKYGSNVGFSKRTIISYEEKEDDRFRRRSEEVK